MTDVWCPSQTDHISQAQDPEILEMPGGEQAVGHLAMVGPQLGGWGFVPVGAWCGLVPVSLPGMRVVLNILSIW